MHGPEHALVFPAAAGRVFCCSLAMSCPMLTCCCVLRASLRSLFCYCESDFPLLGNNDTTVLTCTKSADAVVAAPKEVSAPPSPPAQSIIDSKVSGSDEKKSKGPERSAKQKAADDAKVLEAAIEEKEALKAAKLARSYMKKETERRLMARKREEEERLALAEKRARVLAGVLKAQVEECLKELKAAKEQQRMDEQAVSEANSQAEAPPEASAGSEVRAFVSRVAALCVLPPCVPLSCFACGAACCASCSCLLAPASASFAPPRGSFGLLAAAPASLRLLAPCVPLSRFVCGCSVPRVPRSRLLLPPCACFCLSLLLPLSRLLAPPRG